MKLYIKKERLIFYAWISLFHLIITQISFIVEHPFTYWERLGNSAWLNVYLLFIHYMFFEYTLKKARLKTLLKFLLLLFAHLMLYSFGLYLWRAIGIAVHLYQPLKVYEKIEEGVEYHFPYSLSSLVFFTIVRHIYNYRKLRLDAQKLRIEKQEAELNYLKSQTHPHFLFNTLNNIYSLSRDKSDLAPESILRLSKILRFMLYETGGSFIAIEQELKIMDDYIALEKLRYDESLRVNFNHNIEDMKQAIPPLLLIPLLENAFKHGVSETRSNPYVDIHLSINNRQLKFIIKNSSEAMGDGKLKENIGLSNLRRQLQLLYKEYDLSVQQNGSVFTAILKINLASHV